MPLKVIVSGAAVAGLSLAHWLDRIGATTVIVERAPRFQALGHYIAISQTLRHGLPAIVHS